MLELMLHFIIEAVVNTRQILKPKTSQPKRSQQIALVWQWDCEETLYQLMTQFLTNLSVLWLLAQMRTWTVQTVNLFETYNASIINLHRQLMVKFFIREGLIITFFIQLFYSVDGSKGCTCNTNRKHRREAFKKTSFDYNIVKFHSKEA